jgi:hypothetical protein
MTAVSYLAMKCGSGNNNLLFEEAAETDLLFLHMRPTTVQNKDDLVWLMRPRINGSQVWLLRPGPNGGPIWLQRPRLAGK